LSQKNTPLLFDLFHFHFQTGILSEHIGVVQIQKNIAQSCKTGKIAQLISTYNIDVALYFKLYLLKTVSYYLNIFQQQRSLSLQHQWLLKAWNQALENACTYQTETGHRKIFVKALNQQLKRTAHAYLKFSEGTLAHLKPSSDVDILVLEADIKSLVNYCRQHLLVKKIKTHQKSFMTIVELYFKDNSFLSIDLLHQFKRKGIQLLAAKPLLISASPNQEGIMVPDARFDFEYCFLFYTLNGAAIPEKYKAFYRQQNELKNNSIFNYMNKKYDLRLLDNKALFSDHPLFKIRALAKINATSFNRKINGWMNQLNYVLDTLKDMSYRKGMVITFSGVDGAGKTTIIDIFKKKLETKYRKEVVLLRHRPGILPILSALKHGKEQAEQIASVTMPRKGKNNNVLSSLIRFSYYFTDYMIGQVYVYFKYVLRGKVVVYDRYYFDFINDAKRSNIQLNRSFLKALYRLVFKPKLNFFLYADAETILARKKEMIAPEIDQLTILYKNLFIQMSHQYKSSEYTIIENKQLALTLNKIMKTYAEVA
jgi:thymidylate kinase